jgi:hypothetical protein
MGAVGVCGIPRHSQRQRHRPAKSEPKSAFRFRCRGPLVADPPHCVLDAAVTSLPRCCARATPSPPRVRHAPGAGHQPPAQRRQPRPGAPTGPACAGSAPPEPGVREPGFGNRERTANLAVFGPPWVGGGPCPPSSTTRLQPAPQPGSPSVCAGLPPGNGCGVGYCHPSPGAGLLPSTAPLCSY